MKCTLSLHGVSMQHSVLSHPRWMEVVEDKENQQMKYTSAGVMWWTVQSICEDGEEIWKWRGKREDQNIITTMRCSLSNSCGNQTTTLPLIHCQQNYSEWTKYCLKCLATGIYPQSAVAKYIAYKKIFFRKTKSLNKPKKKSQINFRQSKLTKKTKSWKNG